ncbi:SDR family NAD(P)-dependent oxidoreductase [Actinocrispum wychmicini]|uniref:Short-subunit dehydrogenase n=1 Tax=Actinocrispum wychmicini TaxID=1213861 RepID=A0A4R2JZA4_9PSEU|nr:SDR family oxidoreductase [Actinocrispum wychmicini]TCO65953.1 hypothetical protein EV192_1011745 [Actinocrispum wychmicini]
MTRTGMTALITGASAGIGAEFARLFAADGHDLVLVARRRAKLETLADQLRDAHGIDVSVIAADLSDPTEPARVHAEMTQAGIEVEFLVNNAGFGTNGSFATLDLARELAMIELNVKALTRLTGLFLPSMVARESGRILNVASSAGFLPGPYMATYYASKSFVVNFTEAIAYELRGSGVTATVLCPGPSATEFATVAGAQRSPLFTSGLTDAATVARSGFEAMKAGKTIAIPDLGTKFRAEVLRVAPRSAIRAIAARLNRP